MTLFTLSFVLLNTEVNMLIKIVHRAINVKQVNSNFNSRIVHIFIHLGSN